MLRDRAAQATERNKHETAAGHYLELEALDPREPDWPRRAALCFQRKGSVSNMLKANSRAAHSYAAGGFDKKAIAMCELVLTTSPGFREMQDLRDSLLSTGFKSNTLAAGQVLELNIPVVEIGNSAFSSSEAFVLSRLAEQRMSLDELVDICPIAPSLVTGIVEQQLRRGTLSVVTTIAPPRRLARGTNPPKKFDPEHS